VREVYARKTMRSNARLRRRFKPRYRLTGGCALRVLQRRRHKTRRVYVAAREATRCGSISGRTARAC